MNKQLQILLSNSLNHYRSRQFKKALNAARIAIDFGNTEGTSIPGMIRANLILARIYNTNGRYQHDPASFQKALYYISEATRLHEFCNSREDHAEIERIKGQVYLNLKDLTRAEKHLLKSLDLSSASQHLAGIVLSLNYLSEVYKELENGKQAIQYAEEALDNLLSQKKHHQPDLWNETYLKLTNAYMLAGKHIQALKYSHEMRNLSRQTGDLEKEVIALQHLSTISGLKGNYHIGIQYLREALEKCESIGYRDLIVKLHLQTGRHFTGLMQDREAVRIYESVLSNHPDMLAEPARIGILLEIGTLQLRLEQPEKAIIVLQEALVLAEQSHFISQQAEILSHLSHANLQLNRISDARHDAGFASELFSQLGKESLLAIANLNLAEIAWKDQQTPTAIRLATEALDMAVQENNRFSQLRAYRLLASLYKAQDHYQQALSYEEKLTALQGNMLREQQERVRSEAPALSAFSENRKANAQLIQVNENHTPVDHRQEVNNPQDEQLQLANHVLEQFAHAANHDLKEPIRMIRSFTQIVQRKTEELLAEDEKIYFTYIYDGVERMTELVDGLTRYAAAGGKEVTYGMADLDQIIQTCVKKLDPVIKNANVNLQTDTLPTIISSQPLLIELFSILISNALKFHAPGKEPDIHIGYQEDEHSHLVFVRDNGIGIAPAYQEKIFYIFNRLNARQHYPGAGVGLAIGKKIISQLGGKIRIESREGEGSTFYVSLPKKDQALAVQSGKA